MSLGIKKSERELSIGEIISESFNLYSARFVDFLIPYLFAALVTGVFSMAVYQMLLMPMPPIPEPTAPPEELLRWLGGVFLPWLANLIAVAILVGFVSWIVNTIVSGIAIKYASDLLEKGDASLQVGFNFTVSRLVSLLTVGIITGFLIILGLICLIVPGIIISIMFALVTPVIIIERVGALDSLGKSRRLVSRRWGKTFAVLLLVSIIIGIATSMASVIVRPLGPVGSIVSSLITALIQPVFPIALTFLYYSMVAKEAPAPTAPSKYCPHCGRQIPLDSRFCPHCGKEIDSPL